MGGEEEKEEEEAAVPPPHQKKCHAPLPPPPFLFLFLVTSCLASPASNANEGDVEAEHIDRCSRAHHTMETDKWPALPPLHNLSRGIGDTIFFVCFFFLFVFRPGLVFPRVGKVGGDRFSAEEHQKA